MGNRARFGWVVAGALVACSERPATVEAPAPKAGALLAAPPDARPSMGAPPSPRAAGSEVAAPPEAKTPTSTEAAAKTPSGARVYAKARFVWIQQAPRGSPGWIGYMSYGGSLALKGGSVEAARVVGSGGCRAWLAVEPMGYVCEGDTATVDPEDPVVKELARDAPKVDSAWPYEYAESHGVWRYPHIPTEAEQQKAEFDLAGHLAKIQAARDGGAVAASLVAVDLAPAGEAAPDLHEMSPLIREARRFVQLGSTVAYSRAFDVGGRAFLLTSDHALVPKDRVHPYPHSTFHGVELDGKKEALPIAFIRKADAPKLRRVAGGKFEETGASWPRLSHVAVTGKKEIVDFKIYWETREDGAWVREPEATVVEKSAPPFRVDDPDVLGRKTWLDISVLGGTLVAYEGAEPVFATLISPGRGGIPFPGKPPLETASTPTGTFRVDGKFITATMVSSTNDEIVHSEVQYVQNFHGPHALHGAYWHDGWGEPKSGGCVNLAPLDAQRVFAWTEPRMPASWYGLRGVKALGPATAVVVRR